MNIRHNRIATKKNIKKRQERKIIKLKHTFSW